MDDIFKCIREAKVEDVEPMPDIAICSNCRWRGKISKCEKGTDGDWESGYYDIDLCPKCDDGGCIDDYTMSNKQAKLWEEWAKRNGIELKDYEY